VGILGTEMKKTKTRKKSLKGDAIEVIIRHQKGSRKGKKIPGEATKRYRKEE